MSWCSKDRSVLLHIGVPSFGETTMWLVTEHQQGNVLDRKASELERGTKKSPQQPSLDIPTL